MQFVPALIDDPSWRFVGNRVGRDSPSRASAESPGKWKWRSIPEKSGFFPSCRRGALIAAVVIGSRSDRHFLGPRNTHKVGMIAAKVPGSGRGSFRALTVARAGRFAAESGARRQNCRVGAASQRPMWQMELIENTHRKQLLATKARLRLRVICATPFQKQPVGGGSERFISCVCRSPR